MTRGSWRAGPVLVLMALLVSACSIQVLTARTDDAGPSGPLERTPAPAQESPPADGVTARRALAALPVKGRAPRSGYSRDAFGQSWRDLDRNGCDQRNDVLRRDLRDITLKAGTRGCLVLSGTLVSPYSGGTVEFTRGTTTSREVQVDHVVALGDAWQKGAQQWSAERRERFANDFLELRATDMHTNASKRDGDAATWLPPRRAFRCGYVARQIAVKRAYGLWVTRAERDAMARVLADCPAQGLPRRYDVPLGGGPEVTAP